MRYAPRWRRWIPTGRQIRFAVQSRVAIALPGIAAYFNYYARSLSHKELKSFLVEGWTARSVDRISDFEHAFIHDHAQVELDRCRQIHPDGMAELGIYLFRNCEVLRSTGAVVLCVENAKVGGNSRNASRFSLLKRRNVDGVCINLMGFHQGYRHYYNWLVGTLSYLLPALERVAPRYPELTLLVRPKLAGFQRAALDALCRRYPGFRLEEVSSNEKISCRRLLHMAKNANAKFREPVNEELVAGLSDFYKQAYGIAPIAPHRRIYVARSDAKIRQLLNEEDLVARLKAAGFEYVCPGKLSHRDQVRLFHEAEIVVGVHGAGLTNLLFMQPGARVCELFPADYVQSAYLWISRMKGLGYRPFVGGKSCGHQNFHVSSGLVDALMAEVEGADR